MRKRIWSLCVALVLCLGLLPCMTLTAWAADSKTVTVGSQNLTSTNGSTVYAMTNTSGSVTSGGSANNYSVKWDGSTLTLKNATIKEVTLNDGIAWAIAYQGDLNIVLEGTNTVTAVDSTSSSNDIRAIYTIPSVTISGSGPIVSTYSVTISGNGSLTVTGGDAKENEYGNSSSYGIYAEKGVTINSGTVTAKGGQAKSSYGIYTDENEGGIVAVNGGSLTATGGTASSSRNAYSYGIKGPVAVNDGILTATGSTASSSSNAYSYGIEGDVTVSGGTLTATGGTASTSNAYSYGIEGDVTVSGGTLTAIGGTASTSSGICVYTDGALSITGGSVTATGSTAGIHVNPNGRVTVAAGLDVYTGSSEEDRTQLSFEPDANIASKLSGTYFHSEKAALTVTLSADGYTTKTYDGQAVTLTADVTGGTGALTYQWYRDGALMEGATGSTLSVKDVADSGVYSVKVTKGDHFANSTSLTVTITKATPVISITDKTAVYTGKTTTINDHVTVTLVNGEAFALSDLTVGYYLDEACTISMDSVFPHPIEVGTYYVKVTYNASKQNGNYSSASDVAALTITPASLSVTAVTAAGKAYNGTATVEITGVTLGGILIDYYDEYDDVSVDMGTSSLTGTVSSAGVGTYTELTLTGTAVLTGEDAANYTLTLTDKPVTVTNGVTISKATSSISFNNYTPSKTYDGNALANPTAGELNLTGAAYSDVTFTWYKDSVAEGNKLDSAPADAGTYYLVASILDGVNTSASEVTSGPITISPAVISISGATLAAKTYDGTTNATVDSVTFSGTTQPTASDYTATASFAGMNAGTYSNGTVTMTLANGNFTFADGAATAVYTSATGTISPLPVELEWGTTSFTYDGQEHSVTATIKNLVGSDNVTLTYETNAATAVGSYTATVSGLGGDDAGNYTLTGASGVEQAWSIDGVSIAGAEVTLGQDSFTYNGQSQTPTVTVTLGGEPLTANTDYTVAFSADTTNAGTVTVTVTGAGNYAGTASTTYTIKKADPAIGEVSYNDTETIYESTALDSIILNRSNTAVSGTLALDAGQTLTAGTHDYSWTFTPTDATNYETITGTMQLTVQADALLSLSIKTSPSKTEYVYGETFDPTGLVLEAAYESGNKKEISAEEITVVTTGPLTCNMTEVTVSYQGMECTVPVTVEKADYTGTQTVTGYVKASTAGTVTLPAIPDGASYGMPSCSGSDSAVTGLSISDGVLFYEGGSSITMGQEYMITVPVNGGQNYNNYQITVTLTGTDKIVPTGAPTLSTAAITYGQALSTITLSGTMQDGENDVPGTFAWDAPETTPDAGSYEARWTFTPENGELYAPVSGTVTITVNKATPTGAPKYTAITSSGKALADANLTTEGGTFSVSGTVAWEQAETTQVRANTAYTWIFTPTDSENYNRISGSIILYVTSSGGSGSSGSTASKTPSQQAADKIEAAKDGSTVEITLPTGSASLDKEVFEKLSGKDVTLEISLSNGVTWTVNGQDIPANADLTDLNMGVSLNTSAISASVINTISGEMDTIQLSLKHDGEFGFTMTLSVPLGKTNAGCWANLYWYNEDTRELEFQSADKIASDGTAEFPFDHASDYAIFIDTESHEPVELPFTDVADGYWAHDEIAWAWENGYMSGTAATTFNPGGTVTRQQVWMILARMAGENPADMAEAKAWAVASGISDGSNPGAPVTRQQLAALLYRYAVLSGCDVSVGEGTNILSYTDAFDVAEYAVPAMQWACGAGIINGTGDGSTLSPQGTATRAQLAVMLYRWLA